MNQLDADILVIGAGAAGLMAAARASARGARVIVVEANDRPGAKILISGGGRCNFTNLDTRPERYLSANPHFARSALARYGPRDFLALVERHGISWYEKTLGQLFCEGAGSAARIVAMLLAECAAGGVDVRCGLRALALRGQGPFELETDGGPLRASRVIVASGGLSIPKLGASGFGLALAAERGLKVEPTRPGLVPLVFAAQDLAWMAPLSGVSAPARTRSIAKGAPAFDEALLLTHRGLSGPAILQASSYRPAGEALEVDFLPDWGADALIGAKRARPRAGVNSLLAQAMPARLAFALAGELAQVAAGDVPDKALRALEARLRAFVLHPVGDEGYAKAEVMVGGVSTSELSQQTMEARRVPGLYFIGEAVDVTGWLGGYNFQWAWASGVAAGDAAALM